MYTHSRVQSVSVAREPLFTLFPENAVGVNSGRLATLTSETLEEVYSVTQQSPNIVSLVLFLARAIHSRTSMDLIEARTRRPGPRPSILAQPGPFAILVGSYNQSTPTELPRHVTGIKCPLLCKCLQNCQLKLLGPAHHFGLSDQMYRSLGASGMNWPTSWCTPGIPRRERVRSKTSTIFLQSKARYLRSKKDEIFKGCH